MVILMQKYFGYSINIVLILAPGYNFFICAKCVQFALTFMEWNQMKYIFSRKLFFRTNLSGNKSQKWLFK